MKMGNERQILREMSVDDYTGLTVLFNMEMWKLYSILEYRFLFSL